GGEGAPRPGQPSRTTRSPAAARVCMNPRRRQVMLVRLRTCYSLLVAASIVALAQPAASAPGKGGVVQVQHRDPSALPSRGPVNALVTIEMFFTPGQSSRVQAYRWLEKLQANHPSRIRLVYRIVESGGNARLPRAALEAHAQGKFFEFMDALNAARDPRPPDKELLDMGSKVGLDPERLAIAIA